MNNDNINTFNEIEDDETDTDKFSENLDEIPEHGEKDIAAHKTGDSHQNNDSHPNNDSRKNNGSGKNNVSPKNNDYEEICLICRRPESKVKCMMNVGDGISVCNDCLQKTINMLAGNGNLSVFGTTENGETFKLVGKESGHGDGYDSDADDNAAKDNEPDDNAINDNEPDVEEKGRSKTKNNRDNRQSMGSLGDLFGIPGMNGFPNIILDMPGFPPQNQRIKKKAKAPKKAAANPDEIEQKFDIKNLKPPHVIKAELDDYVVGQEKAKKTISVAVYNHYKRVFDEDLDGVELEKSNMLMIGPTGSGKTYLVKTLAKLLNVPLAICDATSLTEAGYIGDDVESVLSKLLMAADNDVERAEKGIVFIDEIDKLAKKQSTSSRDVSGEAVQQGLLKLLEGSEIEVPVGAMSKNAMVPMTTMDTTNILFICGGAFPDLDKIIKRRLNKASACGFLGELTDKYDDKKSLSNEVQVQDLREFGMIPEFLGRLPVVFALDALTADDMTRILTTPKNAILKQYKKLLAMDGVSLEFEEDALRAISDRAMERDTGARALRAIIEEVMLDIMYEIPKDTSIGKVIITRDYIANKGVPKIIGRGM